MSDIKTCGKCGSTEFSKNGRCKPCASAYGKEWRAANKEKVKAMQSAWYKNNYEKVIKRVKEYKDKNPEKASQYRRVWREKNPGKTEESILAWQSSNREKLRIYCHNRRAKIRDGGKLSSSLADKLYRLQKGKCACCGKPLGDNYQIDHIMPIALGGTNTDNNIQLLRAKCNRQKSASHPVDFMRHKGFLL